MGSEIVTIGWLKLSLMYLLAIIPCGLALWLKTPIVGNTLIALARMTAQLLLVGFYLQVVFHYNRVELNLLWLAVMITVADFSILRQTNLRFRHFGALLFVALAIGTAVPLLFFVGLVLGKPSLVDAQYVIPIGGMILGNCLRAGIIGTGGFYRALQARQTAYLQSLAQGARLGEAVRPFIREAFRDAMAPTIASISTIGLVALPGMMTGVILAGADPRSAIQYQIGIMLSIFTGTSIAVILGILLTMRKAIDGYGMLRGEVFRKR